MLTQIAAIGQGFGEHRSYAWKQQGDAVVTCLCGGTGQEGVPGSVTLRNKALAHIQGLAGP